MQFSMLAVATMAFAALSSAYTQPVGSTPSGNPSKTPGLGEQVPVGKSFAVTWTPTTKGTVTLVLLRGPSSNVQPLYAIAEKIANSGTFAWTPSTALPNDSTHYGLQIICDDTGAFQYSPQFGIANSNPTSATATAVSQIGDGQVQAPASASSASSAASSPAAGTMTTVTTQVATTLTSVHTVASTVANATATVPSTSAAALVTASSSSASMNMTMTASLSASTTASATASATSGVASGAAGRIAGNAVAALMGVGAVALAVF